MNEQQEREIMEAMRTQAKMARAFFDALVEQQFKPHEAFALTQTWLDSSTRRPPESRA